jgi:hypothetical protein
VVTSKKKHQIISKDQLQTTIKRKGQQPINNSFTIQNPQACHLLSQLGGGAPSTSINKEHFCLQSAPRPNSILYPISKKVSSIHDNDKFYFDYFEKSRLNDKNTEEGNGNFNDKDQTWDNALDFQMYKEMCQLSLPLWSLILKLDLKRGKQDCH